MKAKCIEKMAATFLSVAMLQCTGASLLTAASVEAPIRNEYYAISDTSFQNNTAYLSNVNISNFQEDGMLQLTLNDVIRLSKKGNDLTWEDFSQYICVDIGSGLYIEKFDMEDGYTLLVGGLPSSKPYYIDLYRYDDSKNSIDIRTDDVEAFIHATSTMTTASTEPVTTITTTSSATSTTTSDVSMPQISIDDMIRLSKKGDALTWSDFEMYEHTDIGSGLIVWEFTIKDDSSKLYIGGGRLDEKPFYISLEMSNGTSLDVRKDDLTPWYGDGLFIMGDVNADGAFNISDVVLLQKWLLAVPDTKLANWKAADFCNDNKLDVIDLCLMKRAFLNDVKTSESVENRT